MLCRRSADSDDRTTNSVELQPASEDKEFLRALVDLSNDAAGMVDEGRSTAGPEKASSVKMKWKIKCSCK